MSGTYVYTVHVSEQSHTYQELVNQIEQQALEQIIHHCQAKGITVENPRIIGWTHEPERVLEDDEGEFTMPPQWWLTVEADIV